MSDENTVNDTETTRENEFCYVVLSCVLAAMQRRKLPPVALAVDEHDAYGTVG